jgi:hypothetical protein
MGILEAIVSRTRVNMMIIVEAGSRVTRTGMTTKTVLAVHMIGLNDLDSVNQEASARFGNNPILKAGETALAFLMVAVLKG